MIPMRKKAVYKEIYGSQTLLIGSIIGFYAAVFPLTGYILMPALADIETSLSTTLTYATMLVSIFLFAVGAGQLFWGPLSDYLGRVVVVTAASFGYLLFTIWCSLCTDMVTLIAMRAAVGFFSGAFISSSKYCIFYWPLCVVVSLIFKFGVSVRYIVSQSNYHRHSET